MPTYTFTQKTPPIEPNQEDNFGGLQVDANHNAMTGVLGAGFQTTDISVSPIVSPATVTTGGTTITVPLNAAQFVITSIGTSSLLMSETSAYTNTVLFTTSIAPITIDCARMANIYLKGSGGSAVVNFYFNVV